MNLGERWHDEPFLYQHQGNALGKGVALPESPQPLAIDPILSRVLSPFTLLKVQKAK